MLYSNRLYIKRGNFNKCKEELKNSSKKLKSFFQQGLNKYKTNKQFKEAKAKAEKKDKE